MSKRFLVLAATLMTCVLLAGCRHRVSQQQHSVSGPATKPTTEPVLTEEQRAQNVKSFDLVWTTVRDKHFDPKLNGADWDGAKAELRPKVEQARTMGEARAAMNELLDRLGQTHFGIIPQSAYRDLEKGSSKNGDSGIDLRVIDGHGIVTRVEEGSGGAEAGVTPGWELVAVGDEKIAPTIQKLGQTFADSTVKEIMVSRALVGRLHGDVGEKVAATFVDGQGKQTTVQIPMKAPTGTPVKFGNLPNFYVHYDEKVLAGNVGYIYISIFFGGDVIPKFRKSIEKFKDTDGLIIDVRGNPGGIGPMAIGIGNLLVDRENQQLGTMSMRTGKIIFALNPQSITYSKPVVVLVDGCSGSTSEILAQGLRDIGRAHVIGTPTAGAALPSTVVRLPNGDGFQYAFANYVSYGGEVLEGRGVQPDEVVAPTREALLSGHDPALDAAVNWIKNQRK